MAAPKIEKRHDATTMFGQGKGCQVDAIVASSTISVRTQPGPGALEGVVPSMVSYGIAIVLAVSSGDREGELGCSPALARPTDSRCCSLVTSSLHRQASHRHALAEPTGIDPRSLRRRSDLDDRELTVPAGPRSRGPCSAQFVDEERVAATGVTHVRA